MSNARLQRYIQRHGWNRACAHYERGWARQLLPAQSRLVTLADPRPGERALDVACGSGLVSIPVAERVGAMGEVLATDISEAMVRLLNARARELQLPQLHATVMDAEGLDQDGAGFDLALNALGLMYVTDVVGSLRRMHAALRPGGRAAVLVWGAREHCGWNPVFGIVDARVRSEVCPLFFQLGSGAALAGALAAAGFIAIETERLRTVLPYRSAAEAVSAVFEGGPVALAYSRFDPRSRAEAEAAYLAAIEPYRVDEGYEIPGEFVIGRAIAG